uniref:Cns1/TTC4 wheel domain-containing protein n=1 Tax=Ditylenchus dipsaci TaxID=166011 RepID=A0A915ES53_9BILA
MAEKMDADLDRFMDELAANRTTNTEAKKSFDFDEWCKTIDQHPAFMTNLNEAALKNGQYSETIEALQAMKYSNDEEEEEDLCDSAAQHKDEGNKHFKFKKYRWAVDCYTNGIKLCCENQKLNSVLYANRAAARKYLGNKRSALRDCVFARRFDPHNLKAIRRGAECLLEMGYGKQCLEWINSSIEEEVVHSLEDLRIKAKQLLVKQERDARQQKARNSADSKKKQALLAAFEQRQIGFQPALCLDDRDDGLFDWSALEVRIGQFDKVPLVYLDEKTRQLVWPLLLQYPEVGQTDFVTDCFESSPFIEVLVEVLESPAAWDSAHDYRQDNVRLFVALDVYDDEQVREVGFDECLRDLLSLPDVVVARGLPVIQVYTKKHVSDRIEKLGHKRLRFSKKP